MLICEWQKASSLTIWIFNTMTLFAYKLIRQAKPFCIYCINVDVGM